jgi:hypothetical protein
MNKEFIPYESALALKELGFDEPCMGYYRTTLIPSDFTEYFLETELGMNESWGDWINSNFQTQACTAPTFSQAFRWVREKYNLKSWIQEHTADTFIYEIRPHKLTDYKEGEVYVYKIHEEAELACLNKLIEIVKIK